MMILESAIINLTSNLDAICEQDGKGISSHENLKEKALSCLLSLITNAPKSEYTSLIRSRDGGILLGYLLSVLCRLAKDDKSRSIRLSSIETIEAIVAQLTRYHASDDAIKDGCTIGPIVAALPGLSSMLFKLAISDTKMPKKIVVRSIRVLANVILAAFSHCDHEAQSCEGQQLATRLTGQNLTDTCDNLAVRISLMLNFITTNSSVLDEEIKFETLNFCLQIVSATPDQLLSRSIKSVLRFMAFTSSNLDKFAKYGTEIQVKLMLMVGMVQCKLSKSGNNQDSLNTVILTCLFDSLDKLESDYLNMLPGEKQSELEMLAGLLKSLPSDTMTTLISTSSRKKQLLGLLVNLCQFSNQQPLLFITESQVNENAIQQIDNNRIYTAEKRFAHLNEKEVEVVNNCCNVIGQATDLPLLIDAIWDDLSQFSSPNSLYVTHKVIEGLNKREDLLVKNSCRFTVQAVERYREEIGDLISKLSSEKSSSHSIHDVMIVIIAIETIVSLIELHLKSVEESSHAVTILKDLICSILNWCSTSNRAVSEASLNATYQISRLYGHDSTSSFIEKNTDYIIDQATKMLNNYPYHPEVTNVIAITFKLSSMSTFFYFKDVFERVFRVLTKYHQTKYSTPLTLLLHRVVSILHDWRSISMKSEYSADPLQTRVGLKNVASQLDIDRIIVKLRCAINEMNLINERMNHMDTAQGEAEITEDIKLGRVDTNANPKESEEEAKPEMERDDDIVLVDKILKHCVGLLTSSHHETKILALKTSAIGLRILGHDENTLLPLVHQLWSPLINRLNQNYIDHLEENLSAFECLVSMAVCAKDFIKRRTLDSVIPRLCLFLESQWPLSLNKKEYGPYCMTMVYKCQLRILQSIGQLAYHTQIAYTSLWRIIRVTLKYLDRSQVGALQDAAMMTIDYLIALDADCVWYFAEKDNKLADIPTLGKLLDVKHLA